MKVFIAIDSFKGSLTSLDAARAVAEGIKLAKVSADIDILPLADGGEGTLDAFKAVFETDNVTLSVSDPLGRKINAEYSIIRRSNTAIIEMSKAAGLTLLREDERNPLETTTFGVGELIRDAVEKGIRRFIVGIGGSATNDAGIGMLQALGYEFAGTGTKDHAGIKTHKIYTGTQNTVPLSAKDIMNVTGVSDKNIVPGLRECEFIVACDVKNPLCGANGASYVFGPQKGASPETAEKLDKALEHFYKITRILNDRADMNVPGSGAAGGLGFAFLNYTNAVLKSGADIVLSELEFERHIKEADIVVTGEGRLDAQTVMGKAPIAVAKLAKKHSKIVIAFAGCVTKDARVCNNNGIDAFFPAVRSITTLDEAMNREIAFENLKDTAEQVFRLLTK